MTDSGYVSALGECYACRRLFMFSPTRVPSLMVDGQREPICADCIAVANERRKAAGRELIAVLPGAYLAASELDPESELDW